MTLFSRDAQRSATDHPNALGESPEVSMRIAAEGIASCLEVSNCSGDRIHTLIAHHSLR